jgi:hypothetical protein
LQSVLLPGLGTFTQKGTRGALVLTHSKSAECGHRGEPETPFERTPEPELLARRAVRERASALLVAFQLQEVETFAQARSCPGPWSVDVFAAHEATPVVDATPAVVMPLVNAATEAAVVTGVLDPSRYLPTGNRS